MELNKDTWEQIVRTGRQAALAAGALLRLNYSKPHRITFKGAIDPVTESDLQSQELIVGLIRRSFPEHGILAEETAGEGARDEATGYAAPAAAPWPCRWIIDPLDGTVNFAHGIPAFCVSIALEVEGRLEYGVVYDPLRDELFGGGRRPGRPVKRPGHPDFRRGPPGPGPGVPPAFPTTSGRGCRRPWPGSRASWGRSRGWPGGWAPPPWT